MPCYCDIKKYPEFYQGYYAEEFSPDCPHHAHFRTPSAESLAASALQSGNKSGLGYIQVVRSGDTMTARPGAVGSIDCLRSRIENDLKNIIGPLIPPVGEKLAAEVVGLLVAECRCVGGVGLAAWSGVTGRQIFYGVAPGDWEQKAMDGAYSEGHTEWDWGGALGGRNIRVSGGTGYIWVA